MCSRSPASRAKSNAKTTNVYLRTSVADSRRPGHGTVAMSEACPVPDLDPRVRRTRQMLFQAVEELLAEKGFDAMTMQDIADRSTLNRGTIYTHYQDKFALLAALVEAKFQAIFDCRMKGASATCTESVKQLILTVCDYLGALIPCQEKHRRPFEPIVESTVRTIVRNFLLEGLRRSGK